jgi:hypothetical protein
MLRKQPGRKARRPVPSRAILHPIRSYFPEFLVRRHPSLLLAVLLAGMIQGPSALQAQADPAPLFAGEDVLELTLEVDFSKILTDRKETNPERPGRILATGAGGEALEFDVMVRTRGKSRLQRKVCRFPPLRLNFKKKQVAGTPLGGYDKVKLVAHCNEGGAWDQRVLKEYLAYRIYNVLTEYSFRVRLVRMTYVDTSGSSAPREHWGFLIEPDDAMAERLGGVSMEDRGELHPGLYDPDSATRLSLFQMMIGNTDWSVVGLHNTVPIYVNERGYFAIPYDFDWSGLVDPPYATPAEVLNIDSVRDRVYRGFCWGADMDPLYQDFLGHAPEIIEMVRTQEGIESGTASDVVSYLEEYFRVLDSDGLRGRQIEGECRQW